MYAWILILREVYKAILIINKLHNKREFVYIKFYYLKVKTVKLDYSEQ